MPLSVRRRECPECAEGVGLARRVEKVAGQTAVLVTLECLSCGHESVVEHISMPDAPTTKQEES